MTDFDLSAVLDECKTAAQIGSDIASAQYKRLRETISNAEERVRLVI